jgi:hypothetical protein
MWLHLRQRLRAHLEGIFSWGEGPKAVLVDKDTVLIRITSIYGLKIPRQGY